MTSKKIAITALVLMAAFSVTAQAEFTKDTCSCTCTINGEATEIGATALSQDSASLPAKCQQQCAKTCGGFSDCPTNDKKECEECCTDYCSGYGGDGGASYTNECETACKSSCGFKKIVKDITDIIFMVAGIVGALMLIIHGIRLAVSKDAGSRDDAKSSMWHVIIALIIIALAGSMVDLFINIGLKPAPAAAGTSGGGEASGEGGELRTDIGDIISAQAEFHIGTAPRETVKADFTFKNTGDVEHNYKIQLVDVSNEEKQILGEKEYNNVDEGDEVSGSVYLDSSYSITFWMYPFTKKVGIKLLWLNPSVSGSDQYEQVDYEEVPIEGLLEGLKVERDGENYYCVIPSGEATALSLDPEPAIKIRLKITNNNADGRTIYVPLVYIVNSKQNTPGSGSNTYAPEKKTLAPGEDTTVLIESTENSLTNPIFWNYRDIEDGYFIFVKYWDDNDDTIGVDTFGIWTFPADENLVMCVNGNIPS